MILHEEVWRGIDRLAASCGYSASGLAKKAGLDPTSFNKSKRVSPDGKPRWPSTESIAKILTVTGSTMSDFIGLTGAEERDGPSPNSSKAARKIPVVGFAQAGRKGYFDEDGYPSGNSWDEVHFPDVARNDVHTYALEVSGDSMQPLYRAGDLLVVSPSAAVRRGDRVVVRTRGGEVMVKELTKQNANRVELRSLNPMHEALTLGRSDISWMARILWVSQ